MSDCSPGAVRPVLVVVALTTLALLLPAPASAYLSAAPFKSASDTGVVTALQLQKGDEAGNWRCVAGGSDQGETGSCSYWNPHACVWTDPYDSFSNTFQQWNVPYCSMVDTGWMKINGLNDPTSGTVFCPSDAPFNWSEYGEGHIAGIQQWATSNGGYEESVTYLTPAPGNSFSNPGKASCYVWLGAKSAFTGTTQYWRFFVGCSGSGNIEDQQAGGKYCCGQGVPNPPQLSQASAVFRKAQGRSLGDLYEESSRPFNRRRVHRIDPRLTEVTSEFHPRTQSRRTRRFSCPDGTRRVDAGHVEKFLTAAPPSRKHGRDVRTQARTVGRRSYDVTATTKKLKQREVRVQVTLRCLR